VPVLSRTDAETMVRSSKVTAAIVIPKGFEAGATGFLSGSAMQVEALVDPARKAEAGLLEGKLNQFGFQVMAGSLSDPATTKKLVDDARTQIADSDALNAVQKLAFGTLFSGIEGLQQSGVTADGGEAGTAGSQGAWSPIRVATRELSSAKKKLRPRGSWDISMPQGLVWGLMGCVLGFASSLAEERSLGTMRRLRAAPLTLAQVLLGKALGCVLTCIALQVLMLGLMLALRVQIASWPLFAVVVVFNALGFTGIMMAMAGIMTSRDGSAGIARGVALVLAMIGGGTIPLFFMPAWMQPFTNVSPFKWGVLAFEGAIWRGMSWGEMALPLAVLAGFAIGGYAIGMAGMRRVVA
jgi:ABC-2 type transport system permease protein